MSKPKRIYDVFAWLDDRSVKEMRDIFDKAVKAEENNEWFDLYIDIEYDDDGSGGEQMAVVGFRYETDKEIKHRLEQDKRLKKEDEKFKKQQEAQERKTYEALKKKFEGK